MRMFLFLQPFCILNGLLFSLLSADDHVCKLSKYEEELYSQLAEITDQSASTLSSKWREPSLTVHNVEISGPKSAF